MHKYCLLLGKRASDAHNQLCKGENDDNYTTNKDKLNLKCVEREREREAGTALLYTITHIYCILRIIKRITNLFQYTRNTRRKEQRNEYNG